MEGSVTTAVVIAYIDNFASQLKGPTTLIVDNAHTHTSKEFKEQIDKWKALGLTIKPISPYSPELNIIEVVWRKSNMSGYLFLPTSKLKHWESLFEVLANIDGKYKIDFYWFKQKNITKVR